MPKKRNIVRRGFSLNGQRYREGQDFSTKNEKQLNELIKTGKVVIKTFAEEGEPLSDVTERQPKVETQEQKMAAATTRKTHEPAKSSASASAGAKS